MNAFDRYVGIPYADKGRETGNGDALDCWGLLVKVYREQLGIELPSYSDRYVTAADREALNVLIAGEIQQDASRLRGNSAHRPAIAFDRGYRAIRSL